MLLERFRVISAAHHRLSGVNIELPDPPGNTTRPACDTRSAARAGSVEISAAKVQVTDARKGVNACDTATKSDGDRGARPEPARAATACGGTVLGTIAAGAVVNDGTTTECAEESSGTDAGYTQCGVSGSDALAGGGEVMGSGGTANVSVAGDDAVNSAGEAVDWFAGGAVACSASTRMTAREERIVRWALRDIAARMVQEEIRTYARRKLGGRLLRSRSRLFESVTPIDHRDSNIAGTAVATGARGPSVLIADGAVIGGGADVGKFRGSSQPDVLDPGDYLIGGNQSRKGSPMSGRNCVRTDGPSSTSKQGESKRNSSAKAAIEPSANRIITTVSEPSANLDRTTTPKSAESGAAATSRPSTVSWSSGNCLAGTGSPRITTASSAGDTAERDAFRAAGIGNDFVFSATEARASPEVSRENWSFGDGGHVALGGEVKSSAAKAEAVWNYGEAFATRTLLPSEEAKKRYHCPLSSRGKATSCSKRTKPYFSRSVVSYDSAVTVPMIRVRKDESPLDY